MGYTVRTLMCTNINELEALITCVVGRGRVKASAMGGGRVKASLWEGEG